MVLSTPRVDTLLSMWSLLSLAHCTLALSLSSQAPSTVEEVDGMMYVTEPVNTFWMDRHIQLWAADLHGQRDTEKLDLLLASKTIREMSLLMSYSGSSGDLHDIALDGHGLFAGAAHHTG